MLNPINIFKPNMEQIRNSIPQTNPIKAGGLKADVFERNISNISFTSVDDTRDGKAIRELGGVPCPYTGIPMINGREISHLNQQNLSGPSKQAVALLKPFEDRMQPVEKQVFNLLEDLSVKNPKKNMRQLLDKVRNEHLENIKQQEYDILNRMSDVKIDNKEDAEKVHAHLCEATDIITKQDENYIFRRRRFMEKLNIITSQMEDKSKAEELTKLAEEIPQGTSNMSAFIVKFTQKDPRTKKEKTPYQIGIALVNPSVGSIEHVKPRHPQDGSPAGKNDISNYIYASRCANVTRKNMPFDKWVEQNPQIKKNIQVYMDGVIKRINNGAMKGFKAYPIVIAKTLEKESKGLIKLDTSKLKITKKEVDEAFIKYGMKKAEKTKPQKSFSYVA